MNKTITANFESVDIATVAVTEIKSHFHNVQSVKIHYKNTSNGKNDGISPLSYLASPDIGITPVMQNGIFPTALTPLAMDLGSGISSVDNHTKNVNAEIMATDDNISAITATLRQHGGRHVTVK